MEGKFGNVGEINGTIKESASAYYFEKYKDRKKVYMVLALHDILPYKWRKNHYWRYAEYGTLEEYVASLDNKHTTEPVY